MALEKCEQPAASRVRLMDYDWKMTFAVPKKPTHVGLHIMRRS
jgi:hypothetical protein